ncbi:thioredoxin family protein [Anaerotruncus massiliensis (ex Liu et al. 2021)]|uniref:Thioredoxin family protein n=2 Tax=Anaerotruncus TaxID=244127 RepID=A0A498CQZ3_9FIRM|nr:MULTISPECIES: thioredoxin family protein [Anaerotruncus]MBC3938131.1 TM0996/MTH895 family glutaredoxin-like protein [Anaerotruncus massiliensis (ex Togo et al. 2019)]RLL13171.1 thioredoxin family protein [Anaerotruncus massiliensis (ex Liu et al. 2021)]
MKLFGKKKEKVKSCCCGGNGTPEVIAQAEAEAGRSGIKVLGSGCAKCNALEAATREALAELGMDTAIDHVTDFTQIAAYGVMTTPALVVDGKVLSYGKVLTKDEAKALLTKSRGSGTSFC